MKSYICIKCHRNCHLIYNDMNIEDNYAKIPFVCPMDIIDNHNNDEQIVDWHEGDRYYICKGCDFRCRMLVDKDKPTPFKCPYGKHAFIEDCDASEWGI